MFTHITSREGKAPKAKLISSTYAEILLGRAVLNGYNIERSENGRYIKVGLKNVSHAFIYEGFDYYKDKELEEDEHICELW